jgi:Type II site-specific deoxyribonuclease
MHDKRAVLDHIVAELSKLPEPKLRLVRTIIARLGQSSSHELLLTNLFDPCFATGFEGVLQIHHALSEAPFTKDKFEWGVVQVLLACGRKSRRGPRGLAGHDVEIDGERWSLKTQADQGIRMDRLRISKFMELGKGSWKNEADLVGLRDQMIAHMNRYDRILSLRHFEQPGKAGLHHFYELVEIPKSLLEEAKSGTITMNHDSKQRPKPGYCTVDGKFQLYFDGGTERKLQIKNLMKSNCLVHATWTVADLTNTGASGQSPRIQD